MKIENITEKDIADCLEIYNYYIENTCETLEEEAVSLDEYKKRAERITKEYPFLILKSDSGEVLGFSYLDRFNPRSAYRITADITIYLKSGRTGRGLGKVLLSEIEKRAKECGILKIVSLITSSNESSVKFHERNGFSKEGEITNAAVKFGKRLGVCFFGKEL